MSIKAFYGHTLDLAPFQDCTPSDAASLLRNWGANAVFGGYTDPAFTAAAHTAGLRVFAEFGCFVGESWWQKYLDSRPITSEGTALPKLEWYAGVNPSHPAVRSERLAALEELLSTHDLDGVWLDFIRWPGRWEEPNPVQHLTSFDSGTLRRFQADTGITTPADELVTRHAEAWHAWRCAQITDWVAQAAEVMRRVAPETQLGLFSVPWRAADFDGGLIRLMGQDLRALAAHVDVFSPMVYHRMCGRPVEWIAEVTAEVAAMTDSPVWPIIQAVDEPDALPDDEFDAAIQAAMSGPSEGIILFQLKGILQGNRLAITRRRLATNA
jgi:hypothetical protein